MQIIMPKYTHDELLNVRETHNTRKHFIFSKKTNYIIFIMLLAIIAGVLYAPFSMLMHAEGFYETDGSINFLNFLILVVFGIIYISAMVFILFKIFDKLICFICGNSLTTTNFDFVANIYKSLETLNCSPDNPVKIFYHASTLFIMEEVFKNSFIEKTHINLNRLYPKIVNDNYDCLDFSVLDAEINEILQKVSKKKKEK